MAAHIMNPELSTLFDWLLVQPEPADRIEEIDFQLLAYQKNPDLYILPNSCKWMTPALEEYGNDPEGWLRFVRYFTDQYPKRSSTRMPLQAVIKRINAREDANIRRRRIRRGIDAHVARHGMFESAAESQAYGLQLQQYWALGRLNCIGAYRRKHGRDTIPYAEQRDLLDDYWDAIKADLDQQKVPNQIELQRLLSEAKRLNRLYYGDRPDNKDST